MFIVPALSLIDVMVGFQKECFDVMLMWHVQVYRVRDNDTTKRDVILGGLVKI